MSVASPRPAPGLEGLAGQPLLPRLSPAAIAKPSELQKPEVRRDEVGANFRMVSIQNGSMNQVLCSTCSKIKPPSEFSGRAKSTCNQCGEKKKMAYVAKRDKKHIETSEIKNENQQLRLQMSEQTDEIAHLKSVLSVMASPYSFHADFYSQCQRLHERPADYTVSYQMLASQLNASRRGAPTKPEGARYMPPYQIQQQVYEPDLRDVGPNAEAKRRRPDSGLTNHQSTEKWRKVDSAFGSARTAALAAEKARNDIQQLSSQKDEMRTGHDINSAPLMNLLCAAAIATSE